MKLDKFYSLFQTHYDGRVHAVRCEIANSHLHHHETSSWHSLGWMLQINVMWWCSVGNEDLKRTRQQLKTTQTRWDEMINFAYFSTFLVDPKSDKYLSHLTNWWLFLYYTRILTLFNEKSLLSSDLHAKFESITKHEWKRVILPLANSIWTRLRLSRYSISKLSNSSGILVATAFLTSMEFHKVLIKFLLF